MGDLCRCNRGPILQTLFYRNTYVYNYTQQRRQLNLLIKICLQTVKMRAWQFLCEFLIEIMITRLSNQPTCF